jgi:hypothetical protein
LYFLRRIVVSNKRFTSLTRLFTLKDGPAEAIMEDLRNDPDNPLTEGILELTSSMAAQERSDVSVELGTEFARALGFTPSVMQAAVAWAATTKAEESTSSGDAKKKQTGGGGGTSGHSKKSPGGKKKKKG